MSQVVAISPRRSPFRFLACPLSLAFLSCLSGCLPYVYPKVSWTPSVSVGTNPEEVHAFRVDVTGDVVDIGESDRYTLARLTPTGNHEPAQTRVSLEYGLYVVGIALNYPIHHGHTTLLRLYRPGYQLVEIKSWELPGKITWTPAPDLAAQEKAVDDLLNVPTIGPRLGLSGNWLDKDLQGNIALQPGWVSAKHREALLFAASEYDRLALLTPNASEQDRQIRARLLSKSNSLRDLANPPITTSK
jgi:hypothetical protein